MATDCRSHEITRLSATKKAKNKNQPSNPTIYIHITLRNTYTTFFFFIVLYCHSNIKIDCFCSTDSSLSVFKLVLRNQDHKILWDHGVMVLSCTMCQFINVSSVSDSLYTTKISQKCQVEMAQLGFHWNKKKIIIWIVWLCFIPEVKHCMTQMLFHFELAHMPTNVWVL